MAVATVFAVLSNAGAVTALVPATRITPLVRMQSIVLPGITLQRVTLIPTNHLRNGSQLDSNQVQLDVWSGDYTNARAIADACRTALEAANYQMAFEGDSYEPETDPELYRVTQNWSVWTT